MTASQRVFCDEYIRTRNATRSYMAAYPNVKNERTAASNAYKLLRKSDILDYIDAQIDAMHSDCVACTREIMEFYSNILRGKVGDNIPVYVSQGIQEIKEVPAKVSDRINAAEKLAKMLGVDKKIDADRFEMDKARFDREIGEADDEGASVVIEV